MFFSVIVPFYNASAHLPACLAALRRQRYADWELVLVDNGSTDGSAGVARAAASDFPAPVVFLSESKRGAAAARNRGAAAARGRWLAFTDADCEPAPEWLSELAEAVSAEPHVGAVAGCIRPAVPRNLIETVSALYTLPPIMERKLYREYTLLEGGFPTANLAVRRDVFERAGGFDEPLRIYGEDHDLCRRIYELGHVILQLPNAVVRHTHRRAVTGMARQAFGFGLAHALLLKRMAHGLFIIAVPGKTFMLRRRHLRAWLDFNQADKKMAAALLCFVFWSALFALPILYYVWLVVKTLRAARSRGIPLKPWAAPVPAMLLVVKSFCLTCGRVAGGIKNRVLCV